MEWVFAQHCSSSSSRVMDQFVEKCLNRPNLTFGDLWWPDLWPDLKHDRSSFVMIFDVLSNAAYRVSLHGPGAEIEWGVLKHPPPSSWRGNPGPPAGRGLSLICCTNPTRAGMILLQLRYLHSQRHIWVILHSFHLPSHIVSALFWIAAPVWWLGVPLTNTECLFLVLPRSMPQCFFVNYVNTLVMFLLYMLLAFWKHGKNWSTSF